jgi:hypothetical protein
MCPILSMIEVFLTKRTDPVEYRKYGRGMSH